MATPEHHWSIAKSIAPEGAPTGVVVGDGLAGAASAAMATPEHHGSIAKSIAPEGAPAARRYFAAATM